MPSVKRAVVFGGTGFIGRYVVKRLAQLGYVVRVAGRDPERAQPLKPMGFVGQIVPYYAPLDDEPAVRKVLEGTELAVNLVGILFERKKGDFLRVHRDGAERVARLARSLGVARLVHVSAIGADAASPSLYAQSKAAGEAAVRAAFPDATILRPSVVFGPEDEFFNRFARLAQISPILPVIAGETRMQPVYVGDVADAVLAGLTRDDLPAFLFELGGPRIWRFREILEYVLKETNRRRLLLPLPMGLARLQARLFELLPTPPLTRDQLLLLSRDNVVGEHMPGLPELGIVPTPVELVVPDYLRAYRRRTPAPLPTPA
jgi:uncharacterized protein YbjT (DUF2867 family)